MLNKFFISSLNKFFFKKFYISNSIKIKIFFFKNQKIIILKNSKSNSYYFTLPIFVNYIFKNNHIYFIYNKNFSIYYKTLYFFLIHFNTCIKQLNKVSAVTFLIRGVGLRINFDENSSTLLNLKLGFSHLINLFIPKNIINISLFKKKFIICSYNKILLGNFANTIYKYKPINVFTGKGLLKKQKKKFKLKEYIKKI